MVLTRQWGLLNGKIDKFSLDALLWIGQPGDLLGGELVG